MVTICEFQRGELGASGANLSDTQCKAAGNDYRNCQEGGGSSPPATGKDGSLIPSCPSGENSGAPSTGVQFDSTVERRISIRDLAIQHQAVYIEGDHFVVGRGDLAVLEVLDNYDYDFDETAYLDWNAVMHSTNGNTKGRSCFNCGKPGHLVKDCKEPKKPRIQKPELLTAVELAAIINDNQRTVEMNFPIKEGESQFDYQKRIKPHVDSALRGWQDVDVESTSSASSSTSSRRERRRRLAGKYKSESVSGEQEERSAPTVQDRPVVSKRVKGESSGVQREERSGSPVIIGKHARKVVVQPADPVIPILPPVADPVVPPVIVQNAPAPPARPEPVVYPVYPLVQDFGAMYRARNLHWEAPPVYERDLVADYWDEFAFRVVLGGIPPMFYSGKPLPPPYLAPCGVCGITENRHDCKPMARAVFSNGDFADKETVRVFDRLKSRAQPAGSGNNAFVSSVQIVWDALLGSAFSSLKANNSIESFDFTDVNPRPIPVHKIRENRMAGATVEDKRPISMAVGDLKIQAVETKVKAVRVKTADLWTLFKDAFSTSDWDRVNSLATMGNIGGLVFVEDSEEFVIDEMLLADLLGAKVSQNGSDVATVTSRMDRAAVSAIYLNSDGAGQLLQHTEHFALLKLAKSRNQSVANHLFRRVPDQKSS